MAKYIDAEKLIGRLKKDPLYPFVEKYRMIRVLEAEPAADVAKVVPCKECRYREKEQPGMVYCPNTVGGWVDENWFCAGGERE